MASWWDTKRVSKTWIRSIKESDLDENELYQIENSISKKKTKALIIAAGLGSRLKKHTENLPKCMLDFGGKTLLPKEEVTWNENRNVPESYEGWTAIVVEDGDNARLKFKSLPIK